MESNVLSTFLGHFLAEVHYQDFLLVFSTHLQKDIGADESEYHMRYWGVKYKGKSFHHSLLNLVLFCYLATMVIVTSYIKSYGISNEF